MDPLNTSGHIASCFLRAQTLAAMLELHAKQTGAGVLEATRAREIAERAFPILIWKLDAEEIVFDAASVAAMSMLLPFGISTSALQRTDIPMRVRQALLPALRPDSHELVLRWWDETAIPRWVSPFFHALEAQGTLGGLMRWAPAGPELR